MKFRENYIHKYQDCQQCQLDLSKEIEKSLKREIQLAQNIQTTLLNGKKPDVSRGEVKGSSLPARLIGGDYYDFYPLPNGKIRIVIGDVMGKGIPAAMLMILTRGAFRSASQSTKGPGETLMAMNSALFEDLRSLRSFVTVCCADWDPVNWTLTYANAGHALPLVTSREEIKEVPKAKGVMLGGLPNQRYEEKQIKLQENDCVLFYTDGIIEAQNEEGQQYKKDRLVDTMLSCREQGAEEVEQSILQSVMDFTQNVPQKDDITMVILKVLEEQMNIRSYNSPVIHT